MLEIKKTEKGTIFYYDSKPVMVQSGLDYALVNHRIRIYGKELIPPKRVFELAISKVIHPSTIDVLGVDYMFKYSINGVIRETIKLGDAAMINF